MYDDLRLLTRSYTGDIWCQYEFREVKVILYSMIDNEIKMSEIYNLSDNQDKENYLNCLIPYHAEIDTTQENQNPRQWCLFHY